MSVSCNVKGAAVAALVMSYIGCLFYAGRFHGSALGYKVTKTFVFLLLPAFFTAVFSTALSFKIVLHLGEYCYFIADIGASMFSDFMISPYQV